MNDLQRQIVIGTLLGNSRLESDLTGVYLLMRSRNKDWLDCKAEYLQAWERSRWVSGKTYYWVSVADPVFEEIDKLCYVGCQKMARVRWLSKLMQIGYMTWYCDVGCLVGRNRRNACLRTPSLSNLEEAVEYTNMVFAPESEQDGGRPACRLSSKSRYKTIIFTQSGTAALMKLIIPVMPKPMYHLIPAYI